MKLCSQALFICTRQVCLCNMFFVGKYMLIQKIKGPNMIITVLHITTRQEKSQKQTTNIVQLNLESRFWSSLLMFQDYRATSVQFFS